MRLRNSPVDRKEFLHEATPILRKSDESAITIVPSEPSNLSISTQSTASLVYPTMKLVYHPLSFEDELFTARVYKRNYGHSLLHQLLKPKVPTSQWTQDESASAVSSVATDRPRRITGGNDDLPIAIKAPMRVLGTSPRRPSHREAFSPPGELPDFQDFNGKDWAEQEKSSKGQKYNKTCGGPGGPLLLTNWEAPTTPLIEACKGRGSLSLESVIERGESVHTQLQGKIVILTAIHVATIYGQFQALYTLLHHGANVDELAEATEENFVYAGWRPLHFATRGDQSMCLLEHGANVSAKSLCGHQPIHIAAFNCDVGILHILLNHSAQINAKANCGRTPLHLARANSRVNIARDFPIWTGKLDVEPLMKPAFIEAIVSWNQAVRQKFSSPNTQRPRNDTMPAQSVLLTLDYHGGPPLSSLDIAFFRLFLTSEEAEHRVSFKIVSRWYVKSEATNSLASGMKLLSPKSVHFLDSVATFYGTAPVYERKIISAKNRDSREKGKGIYMLYFTIIREEYKIRTILSRMRLGFLKT